MQNTEKKVDQSQQKIQSNQDYVRQLYKEKKHNTVLYVRVVLTACQWLLVCRHNQ